MADKDIASWINLFGLVLFIGGVFFCAAFWVRIQEIEALGLLGQAVYEEQYDEAVQYFPIAAGGAALGFGLLLIGCAEYIRATLQELSGDSHG